MEAKFTKGFPNLGNTCYLNSVIQTLLSSEFIVKGKMITQWQENGETMLRDFEEVYRLMKDFINLIEENEEIENSKVKNFVNSFQVYFNSQGLFKKNEYHDPVECYSKMIEYLSQNSEFIDRVCNTTTWDEATLDNTLTLEMLNRIICPQKHISDKKEKLNLLSVPLVYEGNSAQVRQGITVLDCIDQFLKIEEMNDTRNRIFCNRCNKEQPSSIKQLILTKINEVLIIQLNRYAFKANDIITNDAPVSINEKLEITIKQSIHRFELYSVIFYNKSIRHVTSLCKNIFDKKWRYFDDRRVEDINDLSSFLESQNQKRRAYVLFYNRTSHDQRAIQTSASLIRSVSSMSLEEGINEINEALINTNDNDGETTESLSNSNSKSETPKSGRRKMSEEEKKMRDKLRKQEKRKNAAYKKAEQDSNAVRQRISRENEEYRLNEQERDTSRKRKTRNEEDYRSKEQDRDTSRRRVERSDKEYRLQEQDRDTSRRRVERSDKDYRSNEQSQDTQKRRAAREDCEIRERDRNINNMSMQRTRSYRTFLVQKYEDSVCEGPTLICVCCGGLFFKRSVQLIKPAEMHRIPKELLDKVLHCKLQKQAGDMISYGENLIQSYYLCSFCKKYISGKKPTIPRLALSEGLDFSEIPECLSRLNDLEERMVSPRIPFMRIRPLKYDGQQGMIGSVVNVPVDLDETLKILPRQNNQTETVHLRFMRRMAYNNPYLAQEVRTSYITEAMQYLVQQALFIEQEIKVSNDYTQQSNMEYLRGPSNEAEEMQEGNNLDEEIQDESQTEKTAYMFGVYEDDHNPNNQQTLMMADNILTIAPCELSRPLALWNDEFAEELSFVRIYGGKARHNPNKLTYQAVCKSEFRRYDRRCSSNISKIFFCYKKLIAEKLHNAILISLKKTKNTDGLTAQKALQQDVIQKFIKSEEAEIFLRAVRSTPSFWKLKRDELFAQIRQLGCPTFFMTFSADEYGWYELIAVLASIADKNGKIFTIKEAEEISREERFKLVAADPVTTSRYFENRMAALLAYVLTDKEGGPFGIYQVENFFWRIEFQTRGSPHVHMMTWNKNAPKYKARNDEDPSTNETSYKKMKLEIEAFADKFITCRRPKDSRLIEDNIQNANKLGCETPMDYKKSCSIRYQDHVCRANCKDSAKENACKYGFPRPILEQTRMLEPLPKLEKESQEISKEWTTANKNYKMIRSELVAINKEFEQWKKTDKTDPTGIYQKIYQQELLDRLGLSENDYYEAIRTTISSVTVFLKRDSDALMVNNYNEEIFVRHRGNMDIQLVNDPYGLATYVGSYMLKANALMSKILQDTRKELSKGNKPLQEQLNTLSHKFQNCHEVSAQECVYTLLQMPMTRTSSDVMFVNTYKIEQRKKMLQDNKYLELKAPDSTEIYRKGLHDHYKNRPKSVKFKAMCMAEFAAYYTYWSNDAYNKRSTPRDLQIPQFEEDDDELDDDIHFNEDTDGHAVLFEETAEPLFHKLLNNTGYVKKRTKARVLRYKAFKRSDTDYYRVELMLYMPWRSEVNEVEKVDQIVVYKAQSGVIGLNKRLLFPEIDPDHFAEVLRLVEELLAKQNEERVREQAERVHEADQMLIRFEHDVFNPDEENNELINRDEDELFNIENLEDEEGYHTAIGLQQTQLFTDADRIECSQPIRMPDMISKVEYTCLMQTLNRKQHIFIVNMMHIIKRLDIEETNNDNAEKVVENNDRQEDNFASVFDSLCFFVAGSGGVGKSRLIQAIYQSVIGHYNPGLRLERERRGMDDYPNTCVIGAPTGVAAYNVGGTTMHQLYALPAPKSGKVVFEQLSGRRLKRMQKEYKKVRVVLTDELSMVNKKDHFDRANERLQQIKNNTKPFGGMIKVALGDFKQLPPVRGQSVFSRDEKKDGVYGSLFEQNFLWQNFKIWELTEVMRQRDDATFADTLNQLGENGPGSLSTEQAKMLDSRYCANIDDVPDDAIVICPSHEIKDKYNKIRFNKNPNESITNRAFDVARDKHGGRSNRTAALNAAARMINDPRLEKYTSTENNLINRLKLKIGCKYMVTRNIRLNDGIVNGSVGKIALVVRNQNVDKSDVLRTNNDVERVWMVFPDNEVGRRARREQSTKDLWEKDFVNLRQANDNYDACSLVNQDGSITYFTLIENIEETISESKPTNGATEYKIVRRQLPLDLCEAQTIHKSQSKTYIRIAVYIGRNEHFGQTNSMLYTALSRVTRLTGLYLIGDMPNFFETKTRENQKRKKTPEWQEEMTRMREQRKFVNHFPFLTLVRPETTPLPQQQSRNVVNVICHNIQTYVSQTGYNRQTCVENDFGYQEADIILLVEAHLNETQLRTNPGILQTPPDYDLLHFTMGEGFCTSVGQICFVKKHLRSKVSHVACNAQRVIDSTTAVHNRRMNNDYAEFSLIKYDHNERSCLYICFVYVHPNAANRYSSTYFEELKAFLNEHTVSINENTNTNQSTKICVMGDFNTDFNVNEGTVTLEKIRTELNMFPTIENTMTFYKWTTTADDRTAERMLRAKQLDWTFITQGVDGISLKTLPYECWFSDHVALFNTFTFDQ